MWRLLDLGCAGGRVLQHFPNYQQRCQVMAADINVNDIQWIQDHLSPGILAFQNTTLPSLPIADSFPDLVYAFSVFTHIDHYEDSWLLEILPILKPGGTAFLTVQSDRTWHSLTETSFLYSFLKHHQDQIQDWLITPELFQAPMPKAKVVITYTNSSVYNACVFHTVEHIYRQWGRLFEVLAILPAVHGYQDGVVLRKP